MNDKKCQYFVNNGKNCELHYHNLKCLFFINCQEYAIKIAQQLIAILLQQSWNNQKSKEPFCIPRALLPGVEVSLTADVGDWKNIVHIYS